MNIGIDIDDTISNTHDVLFSYAQMYTIKDLKREIKQQIAATAKAILYTRIFFISYYYKPLGNSTTSLIIFSTVFW